ncbi:MAG: sugar ABC transporter permease [Alphaproteobacteria bacterium]
MRLAPVVFLAPALIMFAVFVVYPIIQSVRTSFYQWDGSGEMEPYGFGNYEELILYDPEFWTAIVNNVYWLVFFMLAPVIGLAVALFLNQSVWGIRLVKSLFFFPLVISQVVVGLVFSWFYDPANGILNVVLGFFGMPSISPLSSETYVTFAIIAAGLWPQSAYCMILYLTGLNNIDLEQIEAGRLDGAKGWTMLWHIILPQLRPATFLAIVVTVIGALRSFDLVAIMTNGGPYDGGPHGSSSVLAFKMYKESLLNHRVGYGAAVAVVLFLTMAVYITYVLTRTLRAERRAG